jgi:hypothetical protein
MVGFYFLGCEKMRLIDKKILHSDEKSCQDFPRVALSPWPLGERFFADREKMLSPMLGFFRRRDDSFASFF